ncbi:AAEL013385-PA [Aedes aegypti]|uniref:AAEL013385-PA n=2 Tax=Aedes aegypti TaxID=7159 RepID=A0A1S4FZC9_AEDAE|nr:acidic mammalian chitinase [Aedes aegypti]EAT34366.1 AAEL013385-PA [Aedes aegypti]
MVLILTIGLFVLVSPAFGATKTCEEKHYNVICNLASWSVYREGEGAFNISYIIPSYCTHIVYTFAGLNLGGGIDSLDYHNDINVHKGYQRIIELKEENPCLKVLLAIGGWNEGSEKYSLMAEAEETREAFADSALRFLAHFGFDGLDVDWEYPTMRGGVPEDRENFVLLLKALREKFRHRNKILSTAISGSTSVIQAAYDMPAICEVVDFVSLMGYDYSVKDKTSVDGPLYSEPIMRSESIDGAISYIRKSGCPLAKINLGISTMAKTYTLKPGATASVNTGSAIQGPGRAGPFTKSVGVLGYNELCTMLADSKGKMAFLRNVGVKVTVQGDQWITYDDGDTVEIKATYVKQKGLGGVMFWTIDTDDFIGDCYNEAYPLLLAANKVFGYVV